jgi:hypothetical protein
MTPRIADTGRSRVVRLAAAVSLLAVPAALLVLVFGGGLVRGCLAPNGCGDPVSVPGPIPVIGTNEGALATLGILVLAWLGATVTLVRDLARQDRRRLARLVVVVVAATMVMTVIGFASGLVNGHRLREGAESAGWFALGTAFVVWWLGLILAAWTVRRHPTSPGP